MGKVIVAVLFAVNGFAAAVTYDFSGGRFGDCLLCYLHAKWFAYKYDIPVAYKSFTHSSSLAMDRLESKQMPGGRWRCTIEANLPEKIDPQMLYICPYFPEDPWELEHSTYLLGDKPYSAFFQVDWKDPGFRKVALEMIEPVKKLMLTEPKGPGIHVALHVREGGGYDDDGFRRAFPLKLPPMQFYIDGVLKILELFQGKEILCQVFTDAQYPDSIVSQIKNQVPESAKIKFLYRRGSNHFTRNVLDDFYSLFLYDVLIRSQSNFSLIPSLLHDFAIVYSPKDCCTEEGKTRITEVSVDINEPLYQRLLAQ